MARHRMDSLSDVSRKGYNLRFTCRRCSRVIEANATLLQIELYKRGGSLALADIEQRAKCRGCGHRGASVEPCWANF